MWIIRYPLSPLRQNRTWPTAISASTRSLASSPLLSGPLGRSPFFSFIPSGRNRRLSCSLSLSLSSRSVRYPGFFYPLASPFLPSHSVLFRQRRSLPPRAARRFSPIPTALESLTCRRVNFVRGLVTIEPSRKSTVRHCATPVWIKFASLKDAVGREEKRKKRKNKGNRGHFVIFPQRAM